jgi:ABC-type lipoprotein export system ATPase subunit
MVSKRAWETYPRTYRSKEIKILTDWIRTGESGSVMGLAGVGKSNLLGFLCHRSQMIAELYFQNDFKFALVPCQA